MTDIVKLYNPANASALTPDELLGLQALDSNQIKELAQAYPNMTMQRPYLLIIDSRKPADKQLPNLSTFENLWNLREKNAQRWFVAYSFRGVYKTNNILPVKPRRTEVVDLSDQELMSLPGFKQPTGTSTTAINQVETVPVTKVVKKAAPTKKATPITK